MRFEEQADFGTLKDLIKQAGDESNLNLFDNVFDWALILANQQIMAKK